MRHLSAALRRLHLLASASVVASFTLWAFTPSATESAAANGDTRTLHLFHTHTHETIDATFRVDGHYDPAVLRQLNHFLRDWRNNDEHEMDPRLFDAVWEAYRTAGATDTIQIYSAYRSPETNAMLRRRSRAVAEHSQHMLGKAMDTTMPGFPMQRIREAGMRLQHGGVGWYPSANFVHLDVGGVRSWPRMPYDQLASLFPDGKTVHIAADGRTLPGYDQARTEIAERGGTEVPPAQESTGFFAWLFNSGGSGGGGGAAREDEEDRRAPAAPAMVASAAPPTPESESPAQTPAFVPQQEAAPSERKPLENQQIASLEQEPVTPSLAALAPIPLPPPRPSEFGATLEIPLPQARPRDLDILQTASLRLSDARAPARSDSIGGLITATSSGMPTIRRASLPALIRQGVGDPAFTSSQALAFASSDMPPDIYSVPVPIARPKNLTGPTTLRAARRRLIPRQVAVAAAAESSHLEATDISPSVNLAGPQLMGLRKAARLLAQKASL